MAPVRDLLMLRGGGRGRPAMEGEALGEVDMRSWSTGSSEAFRFRFDMVDEEESLEGEKWLLARRCGASK